jgi:glycerophosphoryl diester phosphodiesterase
MATRIQLRRGTTEEWDSANPVLAEGEPGVELVAGDLRLGDGVRPWSELPGLPYVRVATLNLPSPAYLAHRGGGGVAPEETMEAFRTAVANGADALEMDCQPLADGALGLMHDATVDRTTDGTGPVAGYTAPSWRALNAAAKFPWNGRVLPPALLSEVLSEFGGRMPLMIEPKDTSNAQQVLDDCQAAGILGSVILAASSLDVLQLAKARGVACYFWWGATVSGPVDIATAVAEGADYLGIDGTQASDATITSLVATGLPVYPWTINRRVDRERLIGLGVAGFMTDQPAYLRGTTAQRTVDSWRQGVFGHGLLPGTGTPESMAIVGGALQLNVAGFTTAVVGEVCPLVNAADTYTIDVDMGFRVLPASGGSVTLTLCVPDDKRRPMEVASGYPNGYLVLMRATGGLSLYRLTADSTSAVLLGSTVATAALVAGGFAHIRVAVTPTTLTVTRTDSAGTIGPVTDSTHRGGYLAVGKKDAQDGFTHFKNLAVT